MKQLNCCSWYTKLFSIIGYQFSRSSLWNTMVVMMTTGWNPLHYGEVQEDKGEGVELGEEGRVLGRSRGIGKDQWRGAGFQWLQLLHPNIHGALWCSAVGGPAERYGCCKCLCHWYKWVVPLFGYSWVMECVVNFVACHNDVSDPIEFFIVGIILVIDHTPLFHL